MEVCRVSTVVFLRCWPPHAHIFYFRCPPAFPAALLNMKRQIAPSHHNGPAIQTWNNRPVIQFPSPVQRLSVLCETRRLP
jgi:hypothetical protein